MRSLSVSEFISRTGSSARTEDVPQTPRIAASASTLYSHISYRMVVISTFDKLSITCPAPGTDYPLVSISNRPAMPQRNSVMGSHHASSPPAQCITSYRLYRSSNLSQGLASDLAQLNARICTNVGRCTTHDRFESES